MACPFFAPIHPLETSGWVRPPRFPLGGLFGGTCHARPAEVIEPPESHQRELCNCGYASSRCDRFPAGDAPDAVRFSITGDTAATVEIVYVVEKDCTPVEHGTLVYQVSDALWDRPAVNDILAQQARAFLESYLSRRARVKAASP